MKKTITAICCITLMAWAPAQAQWGNTLKNKVINKLENKAEEKVDKAINNAVDKPVDKTEEKVKSSVKNSGKSKEDSGQAATQPPGQSDQDMEQLMKMLGGGAVSISDYPDLDDIQPSSFKGSFDMDFETSKNGKVKDKGTVGWYVRDYDVAMLPQVETEDGQSAEARMVIFRKKGTMAILTENNGQKTGMIMKMKTISVDLSEVEEMEDLENMTVKVHKNERRNIDGYNCYKVTAFNDEFESESWVTEDIPLNMQEMFGFMNVQSKGGNNPYEEKFGHIKGMVIEATSTDKKSGEVTKMNMRNIKVGSPDAAMFSTDGYQMMALPDFGN